MDNVCIPIKVTLILGLWPPNWMGKNCQNDIQCSSCCCKHRWIHLLHHLLLPCHLPRQQHSCYDSQAGCCSAEKSNQCHQHGWSFCHLGHGFFLLLLDDSVFDEQRLWADERNANDCQNVWICGCSNRASFDIACC